MSVSLTKSAPAPVSLVKAIPAQPRHLSSVLPEQLSQPRERAVSCMRCRKNTTWARDALCEACDSRAGRHRAA